MHIKVRDFRTSSSHCCGVYFDFNLDITKFNTESLWNSFFDPSIMAINGSYIRTACIYVYKQDNNEDSFLCSNLQNHQQKSENVYFFHEHLLPFFQMLLYPMEAHIRVEVRTNKTNIYRIKRILKTKNNRQ